MTDMLKRFEAAARDVRSLPNEPGTHQLLELYALYKQATVGDVSGPRPGAFDVRARAKHDAWAKAHGLKREEAMARYVALVARLRAQ
jgi:acyl-CoA-binding protein